MQRSISLRVILVFFIVLLCKQGGAQECKLQVQGIVKDLHTGNGLADVHIYVRELESEQITDSTGRFNFDKLCSGEYHLSFSHIGCESHVLFLEIKNDTNIMVHMGHSFHVSKGVAVKGNQKEGLAQRVTVLSEREIEDQSNNNLGNLLEGVTGVSTLKNGNSISKPVVHGLYGNRVTILNHGVAQAGQQWGNDHSPEIDPQSANRIRVIKGVSALQYPGSNLGSVILIESKRIKKEPHLHGKMGYYYESNGRGNGLNLQLQKGAKPLSWRLNISAQKNGDRRAPEYFLKNTGTQALNGSLQLERAWSPNSFGDIYISTYNTQLGVLRGSHIGNITDLNEAFNRDVPFFTEDEFSYDLGSPQQQVHHHLLKMHQKFYMPDSLTLELTYASQLNQRKEFDVRRGGRSILPALSLTQLNHFAEIKIEKEFKANLELISGGQYNYTNNTNDPETGIIPLIPDFISSKGSLFFISRKIVAASEFELGGRYDYVQQNVAQISQTIPRQILRFNNEFHNWRTSAGWSHPIGEHMEIGSNLGLAMRNPEVNELYSGGLHQGVSGIELGNPNMESERSLKGTLVFNGDINEKWFFELLGYYQHIQNYIYLQPQQQVQLTIRGAFPVFKYEQTNAQIYGADVSLHRQISPSWAAKLKFSYLKGDDLTNTIPLIFMPANNGEFELKYELPNHLEIGKKELENMSISIGNRYVFKQTNLDLGQDFLPTPEAYNLLNFKAATDVQFSKTRLHLYVKGDNILNVSYRDYLNRLRYFANDLGIGITVGGILKF